MMDFKPYELQAAGLPHPRTKSANNKAYELIYELPGNLAQGKSHVKVTVSNISIKVQSKSCCPLLMTSNYSLQEVAWLLRGLKHIDYAELVEEYMQKKEGQLPSTKPAQSDEDGAA